MKTIRQATISLPPDAQHRVFGIARMADYNYDDPFTVDTNLIEDDWEMVVELVAQEKMAALFKRRFTSDELAVLATFDPDALRGVADGSNFDDQVAEATKAEVAEWALG